MKSYGSSILALIVLMAVGCATTSEPVPELLLADERAMLSPLVSQQVSNQALSGINSAIHIRGHGALARSGFDSAADSGLILSTLPLDEEEQAEIAEANRLALQPTAYGSDERPADLALYTLVSWLPVDGDQALLEVVTALADNSAAQLRGGESQQQAFAASTLWFAVSRKMVNRAEVEDNGQPSADALLPLIIELSGKAISLLPK
ncbi:MAG: hypothetical protein II007_03725 [Gammaproteobacteria bacterium]|nr:hypothetical protein [Gammaproteobacteria bacterium]